MVDFLKFNAEIDTHSVLFLDTKVYIESGTFSLYIVTEQIVHLQRGGNVELRLLQRDCKWTFDLKLRFE